MSDETDALPASVARENHATAAMEAAQPAFRRFDREHVRWMAVGFGMALTLTLGLAWFITQGMHKPVLRSGVTTGVPIDPSRAPWVTTDPTPAVKPGKVASPSPDAAAEKSESTEIPGIGRPSRSPLRPDPLQDRR